MANDSTYSKSAFAKQLGMSTGDLENKARSAGFKHTEDYYKSGQWNGGNMIDYSKIPSVTDFANKQEAGISNSLNQLVMGYRAMENPLDVYNKLEEASGLPQQKKVASTLREQIGSLEDTIRSVPRTIQATTRESMVTEGQRAMMEQAQKKPFLERLGEFSTALGRIDEGIAATSADLGNKVSLFLQGQQMSLEPLKLQYTSMVDRAARLTSAYGVDAQNQFNAYLSNIKRGWELDDRQAEQAFELMKLETEYTRGLEKVAAGAGIDISGYKGTEDLLKRIGETAAEQIAYERREKANKVGDSTFTLDDLKNIEGYFTNNKTPNEPKDSSLKAPKMTGAYNGASAVGSDGLIWTWDASKGKWE